MDLLSHDRLIGRHRAQEDYRPSPQDTLQFSYESGRYTKFARELLHETDVLKKKTLAQMIEDFSLCENIDLCLCTSDMLSVLLHHLKNSDTAIREMAATIIKQFCVSALGRKTIIETKCINEFQTLIDDSITTIRGQVYDGLIDFAEHTEGINCILDTDKILPDLIDKLVAQKQVCILERTVRLLRNLMQGEDGIPKALKTEIIMRLMNLISHPSGKIQEQACLTLANISFNQAGKQDIVEKGHIRKISEFIKSQHQLVREACCLLLCSLAQLNQGKIQIIEFCQFDDLEKLLSDPSSTVLNCVQLLANLAQNPVGREKAQKLITKIESLKCIQRKYVDETLNVIHWRP